AAGRVGIQDGGDQLAGGRGAGWEHAVLQGFQTRPEGNLVLADGAGLTGEQVADPGTGNHGKSPPNAAWSAIHWEDNDPGAQTGRPDAVGPVRGLLGGRTSPAALFQTLTSLRDLPRARLRRALLAVHFLPEVGGGLVVDRFKPRERSHEL